LGVGFGGEEAEHGQPEVEPVADPVGDDGVRFYGGGVPGAQVGVAGRGVRGFRDGRPSGRREVNAPGRGWPMVNPCSCTARWWNRHSMIRLSRFVSPPWAQ